MKTRILIVAFFIVAFSARADLLGLFTFDGSNTLDSSGLGNHGMNETALSYAAGYEGLAAQFGGNSYFDAPVNLDPGAAPRATFGAWVNAAAINDPARHAFFATDNGGFDRALTIDSRNTTGAEAGAATYSAFNGAGGALLNGSPASTADGWVFVAAVYSQLANTTRLHVGNQVFSEPGLMNASQVFTRIGAQPNGTEGFNGLIDNAFMFNRSLSESEIDRIRQNGVSEILNQAMTPITIDRLWSVDMHAVGGNVNVNPMPPLMSGTEALYGAGNVWNAFEVTGHDSTSMNPTLNNLVDSDGNASSVSFTMNGTLSGWSTNNGDPLYGDYVFVNAGNSAATATWELSGLTPGNSYELMLYGGVGRVAPIVVDVNGNGDLLDDTAVTAGANSGILVEGIIADGSGRIIGEFLNNGAETNWSGFQLLDVTVIPEPSSRLLLGIGLLVLVARLRRR